MIPRSPFRIPLRLFQDTGRPQWLEARNAIPTTIRPFSTTPAFNAKAKIGARAHRHKRLKNSRPRISDAYTIRLLRQKKAALLARQQELNVIREEAKGNPIHGAPESTPFVKSLKLAMPEDKIHIPNTEDGLAPATPPNVIDIALTSQADILSSENTGVAKPKYLNNFLSPEDLDRYTQGSRDLTRPLPNEDRDAADPEKQAQAAQAHMVNHAIRTAALARAMAVENTSSRQRHRINTQRVIEEFGRHTTDRTLRPRIDREGNVVQKERVGPDTGSSEVQIGVLTAKIKLLAAEFEGRSRNDKFNKRNLRLLLHRRQKLLRYFHRKDRGGDRWQHLIEKLGLTPATWEGEIEVR